MDRDLDICTITERKCVITTDTDGATAEEFTDYLLETIERGCLLDPVQISIDGSEKI